MGKTLTGVTTDEYSAVSHSQHVSRFLYFAVDNLDITLNNRRNGTIIKHAVTRIAVC